MKGNSSIGMKKHGRSGKAPKSPRFRMQRELELRREENEAKGKAKAPDMKGSIKELFGGR